MSKVMTGTSIPASWTLLPLKELGDWSGGGTPSKAKPQYWQGGTIPWVSPKDMKTERISDSEDHITKEAISHSATSLINAGSVLIVTRSGILRHTLPVAVSSVAVTVNQDLKALTPRNGIMAEYVAWALRAFGRDILNTCSKQGTTVNSVETAKLLRFEIPVAPTEQQHTIVAEIEKQFSRLDEAVANLKRVKANLKRYKAAVLKAAVEGKLTEDWRKQHPNVEAASKLLERILRIRCSQWKGKGKYKEPATAKISNSSQLPAMPEGWTFVSLEQLLPPMREAMKTGPFGSLLKKHEHQTQGVAVLGIENIEAMRFVRGSKIHITQRKAEDLADYKVMPYDVLISRSGTVGEVCVVPKNIGEARISTNLMKVSLAKDGMLPEFFVLLFNGSLFILNQVADLCKGSTRSFLNQEILRQLCFVLPPLAEQREIVAEVERRLSVIEELVAAVQDNLTRADRLRQSILSQAFSGQLVKQGS